MTWLELIAVWGIAWKAFAIGATIAVGKWWYQTKQNNRYI